MPLTIANGVPTGNLMWSGWRSRLLLMNHTSLRPRVAWACSLCDVADIWKSVVVPLLQSTRLFICSKLILDKSDANKSWRVLLYLPLLLDRTRIVLHNWVALCGPINLINQNGESLRQWNSRSNHRLGCYAEAHRSLSSRLLSICEHSEPPPRRYWRVLIILSLFFTCLAEKSQIR